MGKRHYSWKEIVSKLPTLKLTQCLMSMEREAKNALFKKSNDPERVQKKLERYLLTKQQLESRRHSERAAAIKAINKARNKRGRLRNLARKNRKLAACSGVGLSLTKDNH